MQPPKSAIEQLTPHTDGRIVDSDGDEYVDMKTTNLNLLKMFLEGAGIDGKMAIVQTVQGPAIVNSLAFSYNTKCEQTMENLTYIVLTYGGLVRAFGDYEKKVRGMTHVDLN